MAVAAEEEGVVAFGGRLSKADMNTGKGKEGRLANDGFNHVVKVLNGQEPVNFKVRNFYSDSENYKVREAEEAMDKFIEAIPDRKSVFEVEATRAMARKVNLPSICLLHTAGRM